MERFKQAWQVYPLLPMKSATVLPDGGMGWKNIPLTYSGREFPVMILSRNAAIAEQKLTKRGLIYRVIVRCECGDYMPFGKMGQHYNSRRCEKKRTKR